MRFYPGQISHRGLNALVSILSVWRDEHCVSLYNRKNEKLHLDTKWTSAGEILIGCLVEKRTSSSVLLAF